MRVPTTARAFFRRDGGLTWRLALTVALVYATHFASNVVRETYLAMTLGEHGTVRVDEYLGLHPDLFAIPGRGAYVNNNPGASMLGAIPYAVASPALEALFRLKPELVRPKPAATYDDPRPNRTKFLNASRERGLDIKLALGALVTHIGLMVPLGALAAVVMFGFLRERLRDERIALWMALLYAFGTPIFFRSAFLNQNAIVAHCVLIAFVLLARAGARAEPNALSLAGAGGLLGVAVLCDFSAAPMLGVFGLWVVVRAWARGLRAALTDGLTFTAGAAGPIALLLWYQWTAFGNPWYPAQRYMPSTPYSVRGWNGIALPAPELLWRNLVDLRYGLFAFCPMLLAAFAAPFMRRRERPIAYELTVILGASAALYHFSSANQNALLQWNTGVRYLVPAVPLFFIALVPVLMRARPLVRFLLVAPTVVISWSVAMAREDVPTSLMHVLLGGFELPFLTVLRKTAAGYAPFLQDSGVSALPILTLLAVTLWLLWRGHWPAANTVQVGAASLENRSLTAAIHGQYPTRGNGHVESLAGLRGDGG
jgi:hypothetical protein